MMRKIFLYTLPFLLIATLLTPSAYAKSSSDLPEGITKVAEGQLLVDESVISNEQEKIKEFLKGDGNSVTVYGLGLNKKQVYEIFLQDKHVPIFSSLSSIADIDHEGKKIVSPDKIEQSNVYGPGSENMMTISENSETISTDLTSCS